jgi:phenylpropionate dioxygenase-like ring-hydroxylating dioxygenase large terminal subunit
VFSKNPHRKDGAAPKRFASVTSDTTGNDKDAVTTNIADADAGDDDQDAFVWSKQWYPVFPLSYLQEQNIENKPFPFQLLGRNLVAWKSDNDNDDTDTDSTWSVMVDECPHRKAPLSTGKVVGGCNLMCRFHGWQFSSDGTCTDIPMFPRGEEGDDDDTTKLNALLQKNDAFRVRSFPTQTAGGLLWVYLGGGGGAPPTMMIPEGALLPEEVAQTCDWIVASFPVSYMSMVENSFDPAHAPFIHEDVFGFSPEGATPMKMYKLLNNTTMSVSGFTLEHTPYKKNEDPNSTVNRQFLPPTVQITKSPYFSMYLYFVPSGPRETLVLSSLPLPKLKFDRYIPDPLRTILYDTAPFISSTSKSSRRFYMVSVVLLYCVVLCCSQVTMERA